MTANSQKHKKRAPGIEATEKVTLVENIQESITIQKIKEAKHLYIVGV